MHHLFVGRRKLIDALKETLKGLIENEDHDLRCVEEKGAKKQKRKRTGDSTMSATLPPIHPSTVDEFMHKQRKQLCQEEYDELLRQKDEVKNHPWREVIRRFQFTIGIADSSTKEDLIKVGSKVYGSQYTVSLKLEGLMAAVCTQVYMQPKGLVVAKELPDGVIHVDEQPGEMLPMIPNLSCYPRRRLFDGNIHRNSVAFWDDAGVSCHLNVSHPHTITP